jgi:1,4-dihydroxy-6-naphthoate synthase
MKIHIAHSPDSDDAFMFYGLASGRVPSTGFELEHVLADIETLNRAAFDGKYEITAVSFHAYAHLTDRSSCRRTARAWGDRATVRWSWRGKAAPRRWGVRVAILGELTTAFLALRLFDPAVEHVVMPFNQIQEKVHSGSRGGLLIHEGRSRTPRRSEEDRRPGEWWADRTGGLPLPPAARDPARSGRAGDPNCRSEHDRSRPRPSRRGGPLRDVRAPAAA